MGECKQCGECCKFIVLDITGMSKDERLWLSYHEKCFLFNDKLIIKVRCKHLVKRNRKYICDIHNTDKYPQMCKEAPCIKNDINRGTELIFMKGTKHI